MLWNKSTLTCVWLGIVGWIPERGKLLHVGGVVLVSVEPVSHSCISSFLCLSSTYLPNHLLVRCFLPSFLFFCCMSRHVNIQTFTHHRNLHVNIYFFCVPWSAFEKGTRYASFFTPEENRTQKRFVRFEKICYFWSFSFPNTVKETQAQETLRVTVSKHITPFGSLRWTFGKHKMFPWVLWIMQESSLNIIFLSFSL